MSIIGSNIIAGASGQAGYNLNNSLRFRSSASAYLSRTIASPTNNLKWTYSCWLKRGQLGSSQYTALFDAYLNGSNWSTLYFTGDQIWFYNILGGTDTSVDTVAVFRDPSAWYHIVFVFDSANATAANRGIIYVNGVKQTVNNTYGAITLNEATYINNSPSYVNKIGIRTDSALYMDGYLAEVNFVDGQALTPSSFGETSATTGSWIPKKYTGTYGNNGFYLNFSDTSAATAAAIGKDSSGNGNNWTPSGISVTAGVTYDAMTDVPTNTSATVANYATLNPLVRMTTGVGASVSPTISNGNLTAVPSANNNGTLGSFGVSSGQWYWEVNVVTGTTSNNVIIGITYTPSTALISGGGVGYEAGGNKVVNGTSTAYGSSTTTSDVIGVALDVGASTVTFYKNNTSQGSIAYTGTEIYPSYFGGGGASASHAFNFGQRPFSYTPPTGFVALNTYNLPTPTILQGNKYMDATLYTGNNTTNVITNAGAFKPDLVWVKARSTTYSNTLINSVMGLGSALFSDTTGAVTSTSEYTTFNTNGFSLTTSGATASNVSAATYVAWQWQAGQGTTTAGTGTGGITSVTQSVNTTAGFSIVTYTGSGTAGTVTHGLGVAPKMIIVKERSAVNNWPVYHINQDATPQNGLVYLDATNAYLAASTIWNNTAPTSTTFAVGTSGATNASTQTYVAYCWAEIAGFSKFGSYTGNSSADGPFVYLGFRPKFVMVKRSSSTGGWYILDSSRNTYNVTENSLLANTSGAEATGTGPFDFLSNGFKLRGIGGVTNDAGTFIYMAFAENPFKNANAR